MNNTAMRACQIAYRRLLVFCCDVMIGYHLVLLRYHLWRLKRIQAETQGRKAND